MTSVNDTPDPDGVEESPAGTAQPPAGGVPSKATRQLRLVLAANLVVLLLALTGVAYALVNATTPKGGPAPVAQAASTEMEWISSIYAWGNGKDQHLVTPNAVAIGPDGMIWTNSRNRYAVAFNPDGSFDRVIMSNPSTATSKVSTEVAGSSPTTGGASASPKVTIPKRVAAVFSLAVDGSNNLFVGDDAEGNVLKFTPEGRFEKGWNVPGLVKLAVNDSRVAVVGKGNVGVFDQGTGSPVFSFGSRGQGEKQFDLPVGVHIDDKGNVYVADTQNQRVRKYDPKGRLLWDAGTVPDRKSAKTHDARNAEAAAGIFQIPTGVTVDGNGRVVVVDAFKYQIIVLDGDTGKKVADYGDFGAADGQFTNPSAIAYDPARDYFVVADTDNNRLQIVRIPGSSKAPVIAAVRRAADRPIWVLGMPLAFLLVAIPGTTLLRRRRTRIV